MGVVSTLPVLFTATVPCSKVTLSAPARRLRVVNPQTTAHFSTVFKGSMLYTPIDCDLSPEELTTVAAKSWSHE